MYNIKKIGKGSQGSVYDVPSGKHGKRIAMKVSRLNRACTDAELQAMSILHEVPHENVLTHVKSPRIDSREAYVYQYFELCDVDLMGLCERVGWKLPETAMKAVFTDVLCGLKHCHENALFHMDVKPENILISKNGRARLADFGCSSTPSSPSSHYGTEFYAPPECLDEHGSAVDSAKADVWAFGVSLFGVLRGEFPWTQARNSDVHFHYWRHIDGDVERIKEWVGRSFVTVSTDLAKVLSHALCIDPAKRFTAKDLLALEWFSVKS